MPMKSIFIYTLHGTYGRDDDAYGAMLAANSALAKGMDVIMALAEDGVCMAKKGQEPTGVGMPSNLSEIRDFLDLGGRLVVVKQSLEERGIGERELVEEAEVMDIAQVHRFALDCDVSMTY